MTATIMLAKGYDPTKLKYPLMVSEKLDGVPAKIHLTIRNGIYPPSTIPTARVISTAQTRQAKPYPSIRAQVAGFGDALMQLGALGTYVFVAEVRHKDEMMPFKDVSGHCRRDEQNDDLVLNIFDFYHPTEEGPDPLPFGKRILLARMLVRDMFWCKLIPQILVKDPVELATALANMKKARGKFKPEGAIIRSCHDVWSEGSRGWGYQKVVERPTTEVWITDIEEATSKKGDRLGMVGRLNGEWQGKRIGVGPGKMTHEERTTLWTYGCNNDSGFCIPGWATVSYKRDDSYNALREPTFQNWRPDYDGSR